MSGKRISHEEMARLVNRICFGKRFASVVDSDGQAKTLVIKDLSLEDRVWIDFIHEQATAKGKSKGILSERELAVFLDETSVWTKKDEKDIQNHLISLAELDKELEKKLTKRDKKKINAVRSAVMKSLNKKKQERSLYFHSSLERYCDHQKMRALVYCCVYDMGGKKYWDGWDEFLNEDDDALVDSVITQLADEKHINISQIRSVARSTSWRFKWAAAKNSSDTLFGKPVVNLTRNQESLLYWSQVYDSAYESMNRPSDAVINDDDALDDWFEEQSKKRKRDAVVKGQDSWSVGSSVGRHPEIGVVTNKALTASLEPAERGWGGGREIETPSKEEVHELNTPISKKFLAHQNKKIKKSGVISEQDLRSDPDSRRVIGSSDIVFEKRKRPDGFTGKAISKKFQGGTLQGRRE